MSNNQKDILKALNTAIVNSLIEGDKKGKEISVAFEAGLYIGTLKAIHETLTNMLDNPNA